MKRTLATLLSALLMIAPALTQDFGLARPPGGPGGPVLTGITNQGVTGASGNTGYLNTTIPDSPGGGPGFNALDVATGDFNGDGLGDFAIAQAADTGGTLTLFVSQGDGTFGLPISVHTMDIPLSLAAADIDLDGISDLAVTGVDFPSDPSGQLDIFSGSLLSQGDPNAGATTWLDGQPTTGISFGRLNDDSFQDVIVGLDFGDGSGAVQTLFGNGAGISGTITPGGSGTITMSGGTTTFLPAAPRSVAAFQNNLTGAVNPAVDADLDIAVATSGGIEIFGNTTSPGGGVQFTPGPGLDLSTLPAGAAPTGVLVGDVNGDNIPDVMSLNRGSGTVSTFLGNQTTSGSLGFGAPRTSLVGANPVSLSLINFNNDGGPDLAVVNAGTNGGLGGVSVLNGTGSGGFGAAQTFPLTALPNIITGNSPDAAAAAGTLDIVRFCEQNPAACGGNGLSLPSMQTGVSAGARPPANNAAAPSRGDEASSRLDPIRHLGRFLAGLLTIGSPRPPAFARFPSFAAPQIRAQVEPAQVVFTATGASSGDFFKMEIIDKSGRVHRGMLPEGVVLEPVAAPPAPAATDPGVTTQDVSGFCLDFAKEVPAPGTRYRIASPAAQAQLGPMRNVLAATKQLALKNLLHLDGSTGYVNFIRQYAVWAKRENWDIKKFGESFVERTKKNVVSMKTNWTGAMEQGVRAAIPGRWRDIEAVLKLSNQIATPSR